ncbi:MAG: hypothetical protein F4066_03630 [Chloroflexi bacterium]|nr:hypothetical protein [Chloroflexota bacterium]MYI03932.1 hypothetical protein [Chloroflexota bacterium]
MAQARSWVEVSVLQRFGRRFGVLYALAGLIVVACVAAACGDAQPTDGSDSNGDAQVTETENGDQAEPASEANGGLTLEVPRHRIGRHLEPTEIEVGLQFWLEASEDSIVAALPGRAEASVGVLYQPSLDSPTGETFWIHVYTDRSREDAIEWVRHLASQPPSLARIIVPQHELFDARFREAPIVGDASVLIELHHGHSGGCWQSALLVFAQNGVIVFMKSVIEATREGAAGGGGASCADSGSISPLTDITGIAEAISEQLSAAS